MASDGWNGDDERRNPANDHDRLVRAEERLKVLHRGQEVVFQKLDALQHQSNEQFERVMSKLGGQCDACPPATTIKDHESRLRAKTEKISKIEAEMSGYKKVSGLIAFIISVGIGLIGLFFKSHNGTGP